MKLIVADDDKYTREGLIELIPWEKFGIDEIMQAVNGAEAVRIARWFKPDIVLTDIKMPKMDGIEFVTQMQKEYTGCRVIFISGYMEIEYLRSALRLGAVDYIEKPIDRKVLEAVIEKTVKEIRQEKEGKAAIGDQMELQQKKLFSLLVQKDSDEKTVWKIATAIKFPMNQNFQCLTGMFFDGSPKGTDEASARMEKMGSLIQDVFPTFLGNLNQEKKQYEFLVSCSPREQYRMQPLCRRLLEEFPQLRLGLGIEAADFRGIYNAYQTSCAAINCAFYREEEHMFVLDEGILQKKIVDPSIYGEFLRVLSLKPSQLSGWFEELFESFQDGKYYHRDQVYTLMVSLLMAVYRQYPQLYGTCPQIMAEGQIPEYVMGLHTLRDIQELVRFLMGKVQEGESQKAQYTKIVRDVQSYIEEHYMEEKLSIQELADEFHLSGTYLNILFKRETRMTLKQYLSNYRFERAKALLEQSYDKISVIAEKCGYANANYFAKVFREMADMTPAEYRREKNGYEE